MGWEKEWKTYRLNEWTNLLDTGKHDNLTLLHNAVHMYQCDEMQKLWTSGDNVMRESCWIFIDLYTPNLKYTVM